MVLVERQGKYLLIALHSGLYGSYRAPKEEGIYRLYLHTARECQVTYGIFDRLADACRCYRRCKGIEPTTLAEKQKKLPEIEKLIGGGIFWLCPYP